MSIFELEAVFEVLTLELERCHYLSRRTEFERNAKYTADELDLLAFYLHNQFNVGEQEFDGTDFGIYGWSQRLAAAYSEKQSTGMLRLPIKRTDLWEGMLNALEVDTPQGWTRFGRRLLNVDYESQRKIERAVRGGLKKVTKTPDHFFTTGFTFGQGGHKHSIAICIGAPDSPHQFDENIRYASHSAFEQSGLTNLLLIYWFVPKTGQAYDFIGVVRQN